MRISDWSSDVCSSDLGGKRHDRLFASRHACRERLRLRQHALDEIIGDGAFGVVLRRIAGSGGGHADPHPAIGHKRRSEEHPSELQSLMRISYAVFCLKKKTQKLTTRH